MDHREQVAALEPRNVWAQFAGLTTVPRPSHHEDEVRAYLRRLAEQLGLKSEQDATGNILITAPASKGLENAPTVVLQAHFDMVGEKNTDTRHDFTRDPIRPLIDEHDGEKIVRADGTTLGADNGMGIALALAAATDPAVKHGPLEIFLTTNEEDGMTGAKAVTPKSFRGRILLNLDSEEDDAIYIGCAGGADVTLSWTLKTAPPERGSEKLRLSVRGLVGGHSGGEIHLNRAAATLLAVRVLRALPEGIQLVSVAAGSKRNAIAREAVVEFAGPAGTLAACRAAAEQVQEVARSEHRESACRISVEEAKDAGGAGLSAGDTRRILNVALALPHGVLGTVAEIPGLVYTSNNLATIRSAAADGGLKVEIGCLARSSSAAQVALLKERFAALAALSGASIRVGNEYPGWKPNLDSPALRVSAEVYRKCFGEEPRVAAIHAGLECGIIGERVGGLDMVSFGPHIEMPHSPDERVYIDSVAKSYRYLGEVLAALARG